jgi:hypothetical protein
MSVRLSSRPSSESPSVSPCADAVTVSVGCGTDLSVSVSRSSSSALVQHDDESALTGPYAIDLLNPHAWGGGHEENNEKVNEITLEVTRVVLAIGVFAIGVELPKVSPRSFVSNTKRRSALRLTSWGDWQTYLKKHWKSLAMLIGPGMVVSATLHSLSIPTVTDSKTQRPASRSGAGWSPRYSSGLSSRRSNFSPP